MYTINMKEKQKQKKIGKKGEGRGKRKIKHNNIQKKKSKEFIQKQQHNKRHKVCFFLNFLKAKKKGMHEQEVPIYY